MKASGRNIAREVPAVPAHRSFFLAGYVEAIGGDGSRRKNRIAERPDGTESGCAEYLGNEFSHSRGRELSCLTFYDRAPPFLVL